MKKGIILSILYCLIGLFPNRSTAQQNILSPELDLRNDFAYYIIPIENEVCVVRDKAVRIILQKLNQDQTWTTEKELALEGKKWNVLDVYRHQDRIGVLYFCKIEKSYRCYYSVFDANGNKKFQRRLLDTLEIVSSENISFQFSEDKAFCSIGCRDIQNKPWIVLYNRLQDSVYYNIKANEVFNFEDGLAEEALLSNSGEFFLKAEEKNLEKSKSKFVPRIIGINALGQIILDQKIITDLEIISSKIAYKNEKKELIFCGLGREYEDQKLNLYILQNLTKATNLLKYPIDEKNIKEWTGKKSNALINSYNLQLRAVKLLVDGSAILFLENVRQYVRRPYFGAGMENGGAFSNNRWVDYYYDDILVSCLKENGEKQWESILRKKQFSQDDEGINSSFFIATNKSFLRIIFNDEIKNESTVSEYILLADGKTNRKSLLNTSNNKLNLRIRDAIQIDSRTLIVPSENNGKLAILRLLLN